MKKNTAIYLLLVSAIGIVATIAITLITMAPAMAASDWTIVGPLKPHESVSRPVELESGRSTIEAWSSVEGTKVSCHLIGSTFTVENLHTDRCVFPVVMNLTSTVRVEITNDSDRQVDYRIWVHDTK